MTTNNFSNQSALQAATPAIGSRAYYEFCDKHVVKFWGDRKLEKVRELTELASIAGIKQTKSALRKFAMDLYVNGFPTYTPIQIDGVWGFGLAYWQCDSQEWLHNQIDAIEWLD